MMPKAAPRIAGQASADAVSRGLASTRPTSGVAVTYAVSGSVMGG
jgi:hypothetical protein